MENTDNTLADLGNDNISSPYIEEQGHRTYIISEMDGRCRYMVVFRSDSIVLSDIFPLH